jgi:hypothetical protein
LGATPDPATRIDRDGAALVARDRAEQFLPDAGTAVLRRDERYDLAAHGLLYWQIYDLRRVSGTEDVDSGPFMGLPTIDGRSSQREIRRRIYKKDGRILDHLKSAFLCTQAVFAGMRQRGWGRIINISSGAARGAGLVGAHYNASKAGMEGLTRGYAARLAKDGVTVNAVSPSLIETEMIADHRKESVARIPVGRLGTSEEVAAVVVMVAQNAYMTGQTVQVNGGLHYN